MITSFQLLYKEEILRGESGSHLSLVKIAEKWMKLYPKNKRNELWFKVIEDNCTETLFTFEELLKRERSLPKRPPVIPAKKKDAFVKQNKPDYDTLGISEPIPLEPPINTINKPKNKSERYYKKNYGLPIVRYKLPK
jgi:hypothetical protein